MPDTAPTAAIASPLTLLLDAANRGEIAVEVLSLSFTLDLGFFERTALGMAQALGARVTVVGDAKVVRHDPRAVRRAGRTYLAGLASTGGSFHPKLVVIAGEESATVAVGSGNLTLAGWQENHEIWTVLRAGPDGCPDTIGQVGQWLEDLPGAVQLSPHVPETLARVARLLRSFEVTEEGPKVVSPIWGPVIDQLPRGGAEELVVSCPFHDPGAKALEALIGRYSPQHLTVTVQPTLTVCDGPAIDALVASRSGQVIQLDAGRYRHGKLIEVANADGRWALTGSANCSVAALLKSTAEGGNVELGLVSPLERSLAPDGAAFDRAALQAHTYKPRPIDRPSIVVLGATRTETGLEMVLTRPMSSAGHVELSAPEAQPDTWERIAELAEGQQQVTVVRSVEGGSRLRVVATTPTGPVLSNMVFVADPERALRRRGVGGAIRQETKPFELFSSHGLAERFVADLESLRAGHIAPPRAVTAAAGAGTKTGDMAAHVAHGNWEDYLDDCAGRIGHSLLRFALGLPQIDVGPGTISDVIRADWDEELPEENEAGLEDDTAEEMDQTGTQTVVARLPSLMEQPEYVRGRYRKWATHLAEVAETLGPPERLLALRLVLWTAAAGAWHPDDTSGLAVIGKATEALAKPPEIPVEAEPATASLAAVAVSILRAHAPRTSDLEPARIFERTAAAVQHLLPGLKDQYVAEYTKVLDEAYGRTVAPDVVAEVAAEIVQADPFEEAILALEEHDVYDAHRHGQLLHLPSHYGNPTMMALTAVALAEEADPVGAWAGTPENWALVVWHKPDIAIVTHKKKLRRWARYRLTGTYTPQTCVYGEKQLDRRFLVEEPFGPAPLNETMNALLASVGLEDPAPPDCGA